MQVKITLRFFYPSHNGYDLREERERESERAGVAGGPFVLQHTPATLAMTVDDVSSY